MRENKDGCWGGERFRIDLPGTVIVIADDEGEQEEPEDDDKLGLVLAISG